MTRSDDPRPGQAAGQDATLDDDDLDDVAGGRVLGPVQGTVFGPSSLEQS